MEPFIYLCLHSECTAVSGSMVNKLNALDFLEIAVHKCINKDIGVSGVSSISKIISIVLHKKNQIKTILLILRLIETR